MLVVVCQRKRDDDTRETNIIDSDVKMVDGPAVSQVYRLTVRKAFSYRAFFE